MSIYVAPPIAKAITGPGAATMQTNPPLAAGLFLNSVQMMMRAYWQAPHKNPWIDAAERLISGAVSSTTWHLEREGEDLVDATDPFALAAIALMEKPQGNLTEGRQMTRRELVNVTSRFMGLTGNAFWMMDERNVFGLPNSLLWIRPDRMTPAQDERGNLTGWVLDADGATINGQRLRGIPLDLEAVLHFMLTPPDEGHFGIGLVEAAMRKAQLVDLADTYAGSTLAAGGRLSGLITGTQNNPIPDEVFKQLVRDLRAVTEAPDAARRTTVLQGDVNWKPTGMTPLEVGLIEIMKLGRDDIFGIWQAPFSLVYGGSQATGLNSGESRKYDKAALMQGPVHDRLTIIGEVVQFQLFDRVTAGQIDLVFEEPTFDDDTARYDLLGKSVNTALTDDERRGLVGMDPLPNGMGNIVRLPVSLVEAFSVTGEPLPPSPTELALGRAPTDVPPAGAPPAMPGQPMPMMGKASPLQTSLTTLRTRIQSTQTPRLRSAVASMLSAQREEIAGRIRRHATHIAEFPRDVTVWWDGEKWDKALRAALAPHLSSMAETVAKHIGTALPPREPAKADPVTKVLTRGAARVTKINEVTRDAITSILATALAQDVSLLDIADALASGTDLTELIGSNGGVIGDIAYRSEMIARTELMDAYNGAALDSYSEAGVIEVQAIDGDGDPECAERDGQVFSIEEADMIEDHPNGTLDWVPVVDTMAAKAAPSPRIAHALDLYLDEREAEMLAARDVERAKAATAEERLMLIMERYVELANRPAAVPQIIVQVPDFPTPVVNVGTPIVNVPAAQVIVNLPEPPKRILRSVARNADGLIMGTIEEHE